MVYVRGSRREPSIDHFVKKVWFFLHPSYKPNDLVEVRFVCVSFLLYVWDKGCLHSSVTHTEFFWSRQSTKLLLHKLALGRSFHMRSREGSGPMRTPNNIRRHVWCCTYTQCFLPNSHHYSRSVALPLLSTHRLPNWKKYRNILKNGTWMRVFVIGSRLMKRLSGQPVKEGKNSLPMFTLSNSSWVINRLLWNWFVRRCPLVDVLWCSGLLAITNSCKF